MAGIVRCVAAFVVVLLLLFSGGEAHAQTAPSPTCGATTADCTIEQAYASCQYWSNWLASSSSSYHSPSCEHLTGNPNYFYCSVGGSNGSRWKCSGQMPGPNFYYKQGCPSGTTWSESLGRCAKPCAFDDPALPSGHVQCAGIDWATCPHTVCVDNCGYDQPGGGLTGYVIDGKRWVLTTGWMPRGQSCTVGTGTPGLATPPPDSDGDGTSDGHDPAPNNPGEGGGSGQDGAPQGQDGSKACGGPGQPACDGSNEGSGKGNTSGGGGNCQTPPSSTGDAILAQIAYQAWATRCAIEGQGKGGTGTGPGTGDANGNGVPDVLETGPGLEAGETPALGTIGEDAWGGVDTGGWLGGGSCPGLPNEISSRLSAQACQQADILKGFLKLLGLVFAGVIIGRAAAGSA